MTLTELRYLTVLAKARHFGHAAEQCNVCQPTLSIAIKKLEAELGVDIFERTSSLILLTRAGKKIIAQSHRVLEEAAKIKDYALLGKNRLDIPLHLGAIFTIGPYLFPSIIPLLQKAAPQMPLLIEEGYTSLLRERLRKGEVDVILVAMPFSEPDVVVQPLFDEPFEVILPKEHPFANRAMLSLKHIANENILLLGEGHSFRVQVIEYLASLDQNRNSDALFKTQSEGSSLETLCNMVATGFGITLLPKLATLATSFKASGLVAVPFESGGPKRTVAIAWRSSFPRHKAIDAVRKALLASKPASEMTRTNDFN